MANKLKYFIGNWKMFGNQHSIGILYRINKFLAKKQEGGMKAYIFFSWRFGKNSGTEERKFYLRNKNEKVTGLKLTRYLDKYAATGKEYTKKLEMTIKKNSLSDFDNAKLLSTGLRKGIKL